MEENESKNTELNKRISNWCEQMLSYRIPRWGELPEIELYMDQVIALMEKYLGVFYDEGNKTITPSIINNYVKLGLVPPPVKKRYSKVHLAYILIICILKQVMPINNVIRIIEHQIHQHSIEEVYNHFCEEQERSLLSVVNNALILCNPTDENKLEDFILRSTITANSEKAISEKMADFIDAVYPSEIKDKDRETDKDKKKEKDKK